MTRNARLAIIGLLVFLALVVGYLAYVNIATRTAQPEVTVEYIYNS